MSSVSNPLSDSALVRFGRYFVRVPFLVWHVAVHLPITLILMLPGIGSIEIGGERLELKAARWWSAGLLRVFGLQTTRVGKPLQDGTLFVANHVSWLDIVTLHSQRMMGMVAKREIASWPLVGHMAKRAQTIFHQRGSTESLGGVTAEMLKRLRNGRDVGVFPEGGTRDGRELGPFHARIFLAAVEAGAPVQPVALVYGHNADAQTRIAFRKGEGFLGNFLRVLGEAPTVAEVHFLEPIHMAPEQSRRDIANLARNRISEVLTAKELPIG